MNMSIWNDAQLPWKAAERRKDDSNDFKIYVQHALLCRPEKVPETHKSLRESSSMTASSPDGRARGDVL